MKNYHKDVGFPDTLIFPDALVCLTYTKHALYRRQREEQKMKLKVLPSVVRVKKDNIIEVHTEDDVNCKKVVVRISYDYSRDIVLVLELVPDDCAKVITFWLNLKKDLHENFNKEKYDIPINKTNNNESCND
jgi:hypothetical protein